MAHGRIGGVLVETGLGGVEAFVGQFIANADGPSERFHGDSTISSVNVAENGVRIGFDIFPITDAAPTSGVQFTITGFGSISLQLINENNIRMLISVNLAANANDDGRRLSSLPINCQVCWRSRRLALTTTRRARQEQSPWSLSVSAKFVEVIPS